MIIENTCIPKPLQLFSKLTLLTGLMLRLIMRSCPTVLPTYWHSPPSFAKTFYQAFAGIVAYLQRDAAPIIWLSNSFCGYSTRGEEHQKTMAPSPFAGRDGTALSSRQHLQRCYHTYMPDVIF